MQMEDYMLVFEVRPGEWTWECTACISVAGGDMSPDEENAEYDAEQHYVLKHTDLHPWEY